MMNDANEQLLGYMYLGMGEFGHADLGAQGLTPLRETSAYPEGVWTPMPDVQPGGVQLQDSFTAHLDSFGSSALPPPTAVAPASCAHMDSPAKSFAGLRLVIEKHHVHKVDHHNDENREYTVSNLRTFNVEVALLNASNELAHDVHVGLRASLLYENGQNVLRPNDKEPVLTGETEVVIIGGRGLLKLRVGASVLTSKHDRQRFRVNISPNSEHLSAQFPQLTVRSGPFKSVTKLERKPRPPLEERLKIRGPHEEHEVRPLLPVLPVAAVTSTRTPKASTAAAAAAAQAASQLMHAEAEAGSDGRDSTGRPTNLGYPSEAAGEVLQQMLVGCPPPPRAERKTWSAEEDAAIHSLIAQHGTRWRAIAPHLAGRSDDSVRNRWKRISEERGLKVPDSAPVVLHSATPTAGSSFTVARTLAATAPVGIKGHGMGTRKRLTEMNATQLNSCLSLPQRGPLGQPVLAHTVAAARPRTSRTMAAESVARTPSVGTMGDEMMARLPVARTVTAAPASAAQVASVPLVAAAVAVGNMSDQMMARLPVRLPRTSAAQLASIPSPMSAEEVHLRAELMWDHLLTRREP